jgi:hypothetical protein
MDIGCERMHNGDDRQEWLGWPSVDSGDQLIFNAVGKRKVGVLYFEASPRP